MTGSNDATPQPQPGAFWDRAHGLVAQAQAVANQAKALDYQAAALVREAEALAKRLTEIEGKLEPRDQVGSASAGQAPGNLG